jgi:hypothetical protein
MRKQPIWEETPILCDDGIWRGRYRYGKGDSFDVAIDEFNPPYSPGEVCWVRETWRHIANSSHPGMPVEAVIQYSDMAIKYRGSWPDFANAPKEAWWNTGKQPWRSPVTMPQWASRSHVRILSCVPEQRGEWGWKVEWEENNAL